MILPKRRGFLLGAALLAAPSIVRASNLMPVVRVPAPKTWRVVRVSTLDGDATSWWKMRLRAQDAAGNNVTQEFTKAEMQRIFDGLSVPVDPRVSARPFRVEIEHDFFDTETANPVSVKFE